MREELAGLAEWRSMGTPRANHPFVDALATYGTALLEAVDQLKAACAGLARTGEGTAGYDARSHQSASNRYGDAVKRYVSLGEPLNALYRDYATSGSDS